MMKVVSLIRPRAVVRSIPRYQRIQHAGFSGSRRSGGDRLMSEITFVFLRFVARNGGQFVGSLWRLGKLDRRAVILIVGVPVLLFGGLVVLKGEHIPYSNRLHLVLLDQEDEMALAEDASEEVLKKEKGRFLPAHHSLYQTSQTITVNLLEACRRDGLLPAHLDFKLHVIDSPIPNAFVLPNGHIFLYTGIIPIAHTEGGLACILGHEIAHALSRHAAERIGYLKLCILLYEFIMGIHEGHSGYTGLRVALVEFLLVTMLQVGLPLAHSRFMEEEADKVGLRLAARAGYDPQHAVQVWQRMMQLQDRQEKKFSSSNDSDSPPAAALKPDQQQQLAAAKSLNSSTTTSTNPSAAAVVQVVPPSSHSHNHDHHNHPHKSNHAAAGAASPNHTSQSSVSSSLSLSSSDSTAAAAAAADSSSSSPPPALSLSIRLRELFSTHPCHARRIQYLSELAAENGEIGEEYARMRDGLGVGPSVISRTAPLPRLPDSNKLIDWADNAKKSTNKKAIEGEKKTKEGQEKDDNTTNNDTNDDIWGPWGKESESTGANQEDLVQSAMLAQDASMLMVGAWREEVQSFLGALKRQDSMWGEKRK